MNNEVDSFNMSLDLTTNCDESSNNIRKSKRKHKKKKKNKKRSRSLKNHCEDNKSSGRRRRNNSGNSSSSDIISGGGGAGRNVNNNEHQLNIEDVDEDKKVEKETGIFEDQKLINSFESHQSICDITEKTLKSLFTNDAYLNDIPDDVTVEEVLAQIAVVKGQSITIYIERNHYPKFKIVVPESNTIVLDLKQAIKRHYELIQNRLANRIKNTKLFKKNDNKIDGLTKKSTGNDVNDGGGNSTSKKIKTSDDLNNNEYFGKTKISWRYIWRTYVLALAADHEGQQLQRLSDDHQLISHYGIVNKSVLKFVKIKRIKSKKK